MFKINASDDFLVRSTYNHPKGSQYEMPQSFMKIGQLCAAKFSEDRNWHRGTIMGFKEPLVQVVQWFLNFEILEFSLNASLADYFL